MSPSITFYVAGVPKGQPRPKAFNRGKHAGVYDPGTANEWKAQVYLHGKQHVPPAPLTCPLRVDLTFHFPRPKGHYRSNGQLKWNAPLLHTSKPDRDNADKAILDQMKVMGFYLDDAQVCDGRIRKLYANGQPGCEITVREAQP